VRRKCVKLTAVGATASRRRGGNLGVWS